MTAAKKLSIRLEAVGGDNLHFLVRIYHKEALSQSFELFYMFNFYVRLESIYMFLPIYRGQTAFKTIKEHIDFC